MYKVKVEKECECFVKSEYEKEQVFDSQVAAQMAAMKMVNKMNNTFCGKHTFVIEQNFDDLVITMNSGCCGQGCCI